MIRVDQRDFSAALEAARQACSRVGSLPILAQASVVCHDGELKIDCTDLDVRLVCTLAAAGEGKFLLPAAKLAKVVKPQGAKKASRQIVIGVEDEKPIVMIDGAKVKFPLQCAPEDWPVEAVCEWKLRGHYATAETLRALKYCLPAASTDDMRPHLGCVFFFGSRLISTDGHRLHIVHLGGEPHESTWLARQGVCHLVKLCDAESFDLFAVDGEDHIGRCRVTWPGRVLVRDTPVGAIDLNFDRVIGDTRASRGIVFNLTRVDLLDRLKKAKAMLDKSADLIVEYESGRWLKMEGCERVADKTTVEWKQPHDGVEDNREKFVPDCQPSDVSDEEWAEHAHAEPQSCHFAQPAKFCVGLDYAIDALADGDDLVELKFTDSLLPIHLRSGDYESIVMPIRI